MPLNESERFTKRNIGNVKHREGNRRYREKHFERDHEKNLSKVREWHRNNRDRVNLNNRRYRRWKNYESAQLLERARDLYYDKITLIWAEKALMACIAFKTKTTIAARTTRGDHALRVHDE